MNDLTNIVLTNGQSTGLDIAVERYRTRKPYTVIAGYAGTGKTTLVKIIITKLGIPQSRVCFAAYAGKAANVLRQKGNENSITLHKLVYHAELQPNGEYTYTPVESIDDFDIIVVDEVSMVPQPMVDLLLSYGIHVIFLGDPFQLPPVDTGNGNHLLDTPHVFLDEIMRQAEGSEIVKLSTAIRKFRPIDFANGHDTAVIPSRSLNNRTLLWADEIICATNNTRHALNDKVRSLLNRGALPEVGDKVICLHNYWELASDEEMPLTNGCIGVIKSIKEDVFRLPLTVASKCSVSSVPVIICSLETENGSFSNIVIDKNMLITGNKSFTMQDEYHILTYFNKLDRANIGHMHIPMEFNYGYAITCHKAQGSEWDNVVVKEEWFPKEKEEHARWLYTAVTRASKKVVVVR